MGTLSQRRTGAYLGGIGCLNRSLLCMGYCMVSIAHRGAGRVEEWKRGSVEAWKRGSAEEGGAVCLAFHPPRRIDGPLDLWIVRSLEGQKGSLVRHDRSSEDSQAAVSLREETMEGEVHVILSRRRLGQTYSVSTFAHRPADWMDQHQGTPGRADERAPGALRTCRWASEHQELRDVQGVTPRTCRGSGARLCFSSVDSIGVDVFSVDLFSGDFFGMHLRGLNLFSVDLRYVDSCGVDLFSVDLRGMDWCGMDSCGAEDENDGLSGRDCQKYGDTIIWCHGDVVIL